MQNKEYVDIILRHSKRVNQVQNCLQELCDEKKYHIYRNLSKFTILIQLFFDGMGTTNPLRGQSLTGNIGVFYYTVKSISDCHNSCHANVHLLDLCNMHDLKTHGFDSILAKFAAEMQKLSLIGFEVDLPLIGKTRIIVKLCQVVCDNLALNQLFGFIECSSADYFCTLCLAKQCDIQNKFSEQFFVMRTKESYDAALHILKQRQWTSPSSVGHVFGIKKECFLNTIPDFHVLTNYGLDPMHIVLEGVVSLEMGCVLH